MRKTGLALSALLILYGSAGVALYSVYPEDIKLERFLCRYFLVCDSDRQVRWAYDQLLSTEPGAQDAAVETFEEVLRRDPANAYRWCDLGNALHRTGDLERSRYCFEQAVSFAPNIPPILLQAGNYYFATGDAEAVLKVLSHVLKLVREFDETIFNIYRRMEISTEDVLRVGVPPEPEAARAYFRFKLQREAGANLDEVWQWLASKQLADDQALSSYVSFLLKERRYAQARAVFADHTGPSTYLEDNSIANSGFEKEPTGTLLDWLIRPVEHTEIVRQDEVAHGGSWALRINFDGEENTDFRHVSQRVVVEPGKHLFRSSVKTDGLTTDQGPYFRIFDAENPGKLDVRTRQILEPADWVVVEKAFVVPPGTHLLEVQIVRNPSWKFDNKIAGALWIDGVSVTPIK